jgi:hypothetical protein
MVHKPSRLVAQLFRVTEISVQSWTEFPSTRRSVFSSFMNTANLNRALSEEKIPSTNDLKMPNLYDPLFYKRVGELLETSPIGSIFFTCIPGNATTTKTSWMWPFKESRGGGNGATTVARAQPQCPKCHVPCLRA